MNNVKASFNYVRIYDGKNTVIEIKIWFQFQVILILISTIEMIGLKSSYNTVPKIQMSLQLTSNCSVFIHIYTMQQQSITCMIAFVLFC